jgi:hypothetical protein
MLKKRSISELGPGMASKMALDEAFRVECAPMALKHPRLEMFLGATFAAHRGGATATGTSDPSNPNNLRHLACERSPSSASSGCCARTRLQLNWRQGPDKPETCPLP